MKSLAQRMRSRRASTRTGGGSDDNERSLRVDATADHDDEWRRNRGLNSKTGSPKKVLSEEKVPHSIESPHNETKSTPESAHRLLARANSNPRVMVSQQLPIEDRSVCASSSSSSSRSTSTSSRRTRSVGSNAGSYKPEVAVDVRFSGYLLIKRGLLKMADKRFYFVARNRPELYFCKDETSFSLWLASGHSLDPHGGDAIARASGLSPVLIGTVLRADKSTEAGNGGERMFSVMIGSASKCNTFRFVVESAERATQWLEALQEVQVTKSQANNESASAAEKKQRIPLNDHNALRGGDYVAADSRKAVEDVLLVVNEEGNEDSLSTRPASTSNAKFPRAYAGGKLYSKSRVTEEDEASAVSTPTSNSSSSSEHVEVSAAALTQAHARMHRMDSVGSSFSTASGQPQGSNNGNVLLFLPAAGSSLTTSASRIAKAHQELNALVAKGAKLPSRVMQDTANGEPIDWRYGVPEYVLTDLAYIRGRMREPDTTPLASYVEECCQTFIMEATHKTRYDQWQSVCQETFYLQVNDGKHVPGSRIFENDMLGLMYLGEIEASIGAVHGDGDESQDPRAELAEAFPDGFPLEVLDVFTQPPRCYFSWRHWGSFTGRFRGVRGDGSKIEVRGFGEMTVDASRIHSLRLFFRQKDLQSGLRQVTDRVTRARRDTSPVNVASGRTMRSTSAAVAPVARKGSVPNAKTNDIIEGLANFTLEAKEQHRKKTR